MEGFNLILSKKQAVTKQIGTRQFFLRSRLKAIRRTAGVKIKNQKRFHRNSVVKNIYTLNFYKKSSNIAPC